MFGSRKEPELMDNRKVIWRASSRGQPLTEILSQLSKLDGTDMKIGYWEYGDEIVVTVPETT